MSATDKFPRAMALIVAGAFFMEILDATIITPAIPVIATEFAVDPVDVNVAISAYLVTVAVLIPASGWLADRFGVRPVFLLAIVVFTVASAVCAASVSLPMLVGARILQGVGGALMVPVGRLAVLRRSGKKDLVRAIALLTWPALAAPVLAPAIGGAIATYGSWRWIFLVNIPIGVVGFLLSLKFVHADAPTQDMRTRPFDWKGLLAIGVGIAAALIALEGIRVRGTDWVHVGAGAILAIVVLAFGVRHLLRADSPLLELRVARVRTLRITVSSGALYRMIIMAVPFLLPLQFQLSFGWTPLAAGAMVTALFLGNLTIKPATTPLMRRLGIRRVLLINGCLTVLCFVALASVNEGMSAVMIALVLYISGALRSVGFTAYNSLAFSDVSGDDLTHANTLNAAVQELASGIGVAVGALLLGVFTAAAFDGLSPYSATYLVLAVLMVATMIESFRLPRDAGSHVTR